MEPKTTTVGRDAQRARLHRAYVRAKQGTGTIVAVTGEPGIGKTSLIEDFVRSLTAAGERPVIAWGRCSESLAGAEAYLPILDAIEALLRGPGGAAFDALVATAAPTWHAQIAATAGDASHPAPSQEQMKRELVALFHALAAAEPLVLVIDDLHWADVSTIDALHYLAGRFEGMRALVLIGYRPSDMSLTHHPFIAIRGELQAHGAFDEVPLAFLQPRDIERYLALEYPGRAFPRGFAAMIHAKTEGNPLFMADLTRWIVARGVDGEPLDLPESVRGMIARKIEQVPEADRRLLLAAAVQGDEFDSTVVAEALQLEPAAVEERLEHLERVHVFVARAGEQAFPSGVLTLRYRFVHVLYQNALYGSLQPARRVAVAKAIVSALASHYGGEAPAIAARLAVLYETAWDFGPAATYFYLAAQRATALFGFREALSLAERGLDAAAAMTGGAERLQLELGLQMIRGLALRSVKGWAAPELELTFTRARALCQQLGDPPELFPVLWNLTFFNMIRGDVALVREQTVTLMRQAEQSRQPAFLMAVHHVAGVTAEFAGDFSESHRLLERARELHDFRQHDTYSKAFGIDPGMVARAMSARPLWALGYPDRAIARSRETVALGRAQRQPVTFVFALIVAQGVHLYRGEAAEALALADEIIAFCEEHEFPQEAEWARGFKGSALAVSGRAEDGAAQLGAALEALHALRSGLTRTMFLSLHADALLRAGRVADGHAVVAEGFAHAERTGERGFVAELHRIGGELRAAAGDYAGAEHALRLALDVARQQQARAFELRAASSLVRLLQTSGRTPDGRAVLEPVYTWFTEGRGTADLITARTLLSETG